MRIELSSRAESTLRALPRDEQRPVAQRIDRLAARGTDALHLMVRLQGDAEQIVPVARAAIGDVAPDLAVYEVRMMAEVSDDRPFAG